MAELPKIDKHERMLSALPNDFKRLATWAWTELRPTLRKHAIDCGATPEEAIVMASRLSRLVVTQMYGDIKRARQVGQPPVG
jgi:hypothetical protein